MRVGVVVDAVYDYVIQILLILDQAMNVILFGKADETLSSRAYRADKKGRIFGKIFRPTIDFIFRIFGPDHCYWAYVAELKRYQLPEEFRV